MSCRFFQYWQLSSVIIDKKVILIFSLHLLIFRIVFKWNKFTFFMNNSTKIKSLSSNIWMCFKFYKHLVAWNWDIGLLVNSSEISYKVCIFTSTVINLDVLKSTLKLLPKVNVMELVLFFKVNQNYSTMGIYLNKYEIQDNVGSKIWCNQPAAVGVVGMIRRHQNIFLNI